MGRGRGLGGQLWGASRHSPTQHPPIPRPPPMTVLQSIKRKALLLASTNMAPFLKKHGIRDKRYSKRLEQQLRTTYSLQPAARSGRPPKYDEEQLDAARDALASPVGPLHTTAALVQQLKSGGQLQPDAPKRGFMAAVKRHLSKQGLRLGFGTRSKQQALTKGDAKARLAWCQRMQHELTSATVGGWHFVDEKSLGSGGKPRCEWWLGPGVTRVRCPPSSACKDGCCSYPVQGDRPLPCTGRVGHAAGALLGGSD